METGPRSIIEEKREQRPNIELTVPYVAAIRPEAKKKIKGHDRSLDIVFDEINKQAIGSFQINETRLFPGVKFSSLHFQVTSDLIRKINPSVKLPEKSKDQEALKSNEEKPNEPKHYIYFLQSAFGIYPGGNAYSVLDLGIDRFIREISRVTGAMKRGETPPAVDIYLVGAPHGFGGQVTQEWIDAGKKDGFGPHGKIYAEFMENHLPKDKIGLSRTKIIMQGVSKGVPTSIETSKSLSENIREKTQRLYDVPAGVHGKNIIEQIIKGANLTVGFTGEFAARSIAGLTGLDPTTKSLFQTEKQFYQDMVEKLNLPPDSKEQAKMKASWFIPELMALIKGTPFDKSERTFVRQPEFDPVNFNVGNFLRILKNTLLSQKKLVASEKGKIFNAPTSRKLHFYAHKKSFKAWTRVMEFAESN